CALYIGIEDDVQPADLVDEPEEVFQVNILQVHRNRLARVTLPGGRLPRLRRHGLRLRRRSRLCGWRLRLCCRRCGLRLLLLLRQVHRRRRADRRHGDDFGLVVRATAQHLGCAGGHQLGLASFAFRLGLIIGCYKDVVLCWLVRWGAVCGQGRRLHFSYRDWRCRLCVARVNSRRCRCPLRGFGRGGCSACTAQLQDDFVRSWHHLVMVLAGKVHHNTRYRRLFLVAGHAHRFYIRTVHQDRALAPHWHRIRNIHHHTI